MSRRKAWKAVAAQSGLPRASTDNAGGGATTFSGRKTRTGARRWLPQKARTPPRDASVAAAICTEGRARLFVALPFQVTAAAAAAVVALVAKGRTVSVAEAIMTGGPDAVALQEAPGRSRVLRCGQTDWRELCDHHSVSVSVATKLARPRPTRRPSATAIDRVSDDASIPTGMVPTGTVGRRVAEHVAKHLVEAAAHGEWPVVLATQG